MALVTLQTIFQDAFPAYEALHPLPAHVRKAARAIMQCRTAALGGHVQACPDGHVSRIWYNSCRHRSCPQCAYLQTERWLALQQARLLACDHYHVIFTLPHDLNPLWLANVPVMTTLLFQAVHDTLLSEFRRDDRFILMGLAAAGGKATESQQRRWTAAALAADKGAVVVPSFDDADIVAGQGTVGLEILQQLSDLAEPPLSVRERQVATAFRLQ